MEVFFYALIGYPIIGYPIVTQDGKKHEKAFKSTIEVEIKKKSRRGLMNSWFLVVEF